MTSEYKSEVPTSEMETPFLRALKTSKFPGTPLCPYLEQPNLVSGLPAQCKYLTHSLVHHFENIPNSKKRQTTTEKCG